jgi:signal transduction histidine kinase
MELGKAGLIGPGSSEPGRGTTPGAKRSRRNLGDLILAVRGARVRSIEAVAAIGALVLAVGFIHPTAYNSPTLRAAVETVMTSLALAAAVLFREQFTQTHRLRKLLVLAAVVILALTEFVTNTLGAGLHLGPHSGLAAPYPLGQLMAAALLLLAARTPPDALELRVRRPMLFTFMGSLAAVGVAGLVGWLLRKQLLLIAPTSEGGLQHAVRNPLGFAVLLAGSLIFVWAGLEFARRGRIEQSRVLTSLGAGALLLGAARLYYLALPFISPTAISLREGLRLAAFALIFYAALLRDLEIRARATNAAAAAERRRVAQDLHDSLAQDLAFIAAHEPKMAEHLGENHPVMQATRHALAVSRQTISDLSDAKSTSPREALEAIAHELSQRFGMRIAVEVAPDVGLPADARDQMGRITREAIANAARHGGAHRVFVNVKQVAVGTLLRVVDDGHGISEQFGGEDEGFGISSMRERVASVGGTLTLRRAGAQGTELEVLFPC